MLFYVLLLFAFSLFVIVDSYFYAEKISLGFNKKTKSFLRLGILSVLNILIFINLQLKFQIINLIAINTSFVLFWWIFYNGLVNIFEGHHWFYPHLNNEIERRINKGTGWSLLIKQTIFHLSKWVVLGISMFYLVEEINQ